MSSALPSSKAERKEKLPGSEARGNQILEEAGPPLKKPISKKDVPSNKWSRKSWRRCRKLNSVLWS